MQLHVDRLLLSFERIWSFFIIPRGHVRRMSRTCTNSRSTLTYIYTYISYAKYSVFFAWLYGRRVEDELSTQSGVKIPSHEYEITQAHSFFWSFFLILLVITTYIVLESHLTLPTIRNAIFNNCNNVILR